MKSMKQEKMLKVINWGWNTGNYDGITFIDDNNKVYRFFRKDMNEEIDKKLTEMLCFNQIKEKDYLICKFEDKELFNLNYTTCFHCNQVKIVMADKTCCETCANNYMQLMMA